MKSKEKFSTLKMVEMAILMALIVVLQSVFIFGALPICLCLVPITLGAMVLDWKGGAVLGFTFGVIALFWGIVGSDMFTFYLFQANPFMTIAICLLKGTLAGIVPALIYKVLKHFNTFVASITAAISAPIVNTGIFALGSLIIKNDVVESVANISIASGAAPPNITNFVAFLFLTLIGINFIIEFTINVVLAPALYKVTEIVGKNNNKK